MEKMYQGNNRDLAGYSILEIFIIIKKANIIEGGSLARETRKTYLGKL